MGRKPGGSLFALESLFCDYFSSTVPLLSDLVNCPLIQESPGQMSSPCFTFLIKSFLFNCLFQYPPTQNPDEMSSEILLATFPAQGNPSLHPIFWIRQTLTSQIKCLPLQEAFSDFLNSKRFFSFIPIEVLLLHIHQSPVCHLPC